MSSSTPGSSGTPLLPPDGTAANAGPSKPKPKLSKMALDKVSDQLSKVHDDDEQGSTPSTSANKRPTQAKATSIEELKALLKETAEVNLPSWAEQVEHESFETPSVFYTGHLIRLPRKNTLHPKFPNIAEMMESETPWEKVQEAVDRYWKTRKNRLSTLRGRLRRKHKKIADQLASSIIDREVPVDGDDTWLTTVRSKSGKRKVIAAKKRPAESSNPGSGQKRPEKRRDDKTTPAKPAGSKGSTAARPSRDANAAAKIDINLNFPHAAWIYEGKDRKNPISKAEFEIVYGRLVKQWLDLKPDAGTIRPKIKGTVFLSDCGAVKCQNEESFKFIQKLTLTIKVGDKSFRAWGNKEKDGWTDCSVKLNAVLAQNPILTVLKRAFEDNNIVGEVHVKGSFQVPGGKVAQLKVSEKTARDIKAVDNKVWCGFTELSFLFADESDESTEARLCEDLRGINRPSASDESEDSTSMDTANNTPEDLS